MAARCQVTGRAPGFGNAVSSNVAQWLGGIVAFLLGDCT